MSPAKRPTDLAASVRARLPDFQRGWFLDDERIRSLVADGFGPQRERMLAKFWLDPVALARSVGFSAAELNALRKLVEENALDFREAWDDFFAQ